MLQVSTSSAALDLAHISQSSNNRSLDGREKSSEWPQFARGSDGLSSAKSERLTVTNPGLSLGSPDILGSVSASATPQGASHQAPSSRRGSPLGLLDGMNGTTRSVPATPLGLSSTHIMKTPGTPLGDSQGMNGRLSSHGTHLTDPLNDIQASLSRIPSGRYENGALNYNGLQQGLDEPYGVDSGYGLNGSLDSGRYSGYASANNTSGSTALYHHNGSRYGLGTPGRANPGVDSKMSGLHGPKHKRGDMDRECKHFASSCFDY